MAQTLVAHEQPIQKIFSDDYVFSIPDYQRPYAWTPDEARELIDDLLGFIEVNPGPVSEMPSYFLGSIVLIKGDSPVADVVDGQQRLTTLTLLLAAIRANVGVKLSSKITKRLYEEGDELATIRCIQKPGKPEADQGNLVFAKNNADVFQALRGRCDVAAGTAWLWSRAEALESVDVLFVDEAAQVSLANVLAVSHAAPSLVLLGDPRQLDQPTQGSHPEGTGFRPWITF
jgi:hypothetical protein